ncbi:MAG: rhomboid family intramembrane serine protease [Ferruginibacter sp.]|nr:rhomboid family intramembrane serine protease [Ferruginibacter sp.]
MDFSQYPITILLIAATTVYSLMGFSNAALVNKTILWPYYMVREKQYYRSITSGFLHADFMHLFFNMFTLYFFGRNVEIIFSIYGLGGQISYAILYFSALVVADIPSIVKHKDDVHYRALGASGAVCAVVFAAIVFDPWSAIYLYGAIKISAMIYAILFVAYCVYMGRKGVDNINHDAHLWGSFYGLLFAIMLIAIKEPRLFEPIIEQLKQPSLFGR